MGNKKLQSSIQCLERKIKELLKNYNEQQDLIQQLKQENKQLRQQAIKNKEKTGNFLNKREEVDVLRKDTVQAYELYSHIDNYIKDIDKGIAYLEQL